MTDTTITVTEDEVRSGDWTDRPDVEQAIRNVAEQALGQGTPITDPETGEIIGREGIVRWVELYCEFSAGGWKRGSTGRSLVLKATTAVENIPELTAMDTVLVQYEGEDFELGEADIESGSWKRDQDAGKIASFSVVFSGRAVQHAMARLSVLISRDIDSGLLRFGLIQEQMQLLPSGGAVDLTVRA
jgi:hypothetical protein